MSLTALGILVFLILLMVVGICLTLSALSPKRRGDTPYCRDCGYNLTGLDLGAPDTRCPECGLHVGGDGAVVLGERVRSARRAFAGSVLFVLGAVPLATVATRAARGTGWYQQVPTIWVLCDLQTGNTSRSQKALEEIRRRRQAGELSARQIAKLADVCLKEQRRPTMRVGVGRELIELLGNLQASDQLTVEQSERLFENGIRIIRCATRPCLIRGVTAPLAVTREGRLPSRLQATIRVREVRCGDAVVLRDKLLGTSSGQGTGRSSVPCIRLDQMGQHLLSFDLEIDIDDDLSTFHVTGTPLYRVRRSFTMPVEVLAQRPPEYVRLVTSPETDQAVRQSLAIHRVHEFGKGLLNLEVHTAWTCPLGLAFDVFAEYDGRKVKMGSMGVSANTGMRTLISSGVRGRVPDEVDIILRSSATVAEETVDLFEIWDGEVRFEGVKVNRTDGQVSYEEMSRSYPPTWVGRREQSAEPSSTQPISDSAGPGPP